MMPNRSFNFMKDTEFPTIAPKILEDLYRQFSSKGWESVLLKTQAPELFRIGGKYTILPRIDNYSKEEMETFCSKHPDFKPPTLRVEKQGIPVIYPSDWGAEENEVTSGLFEKGDEFRFIGIDFRNSYLKLHGVSKINVMGKQRPIPNNQFIFVYDNFLEILPSLNDITDLLK